MTANWSPLIKNGWYLVVGFLVDKTTVRHESGLMRGDQNNSFIGQKPRIPVSILTGVALFVADPPAATSTSDNDSHPLSYGKPSVGLYVQC